MLKWEIKIHPKPQGLWRPKISITFSVEGTEWEKLNIDTKFDLSKQEWILDINEYYYSCSDCDDCRKNFPIELYKSSSPRFKDWACPKMVFNLLTLPKEFSFYVEWRPERADYSDYIQFFTEKFCIPAVEEYNRRIEEALASEPIDEIVVSSENYLQKTQKPQKEMITRKVKI